MRIKKGFALNEIGDTTMAIYIGEDEDGLNGIIQRMM